MRDHIANFKGELEETAGCIQLRIPPRCVSRDVSEEINIKIIKVSRVSCAVQSEYAALNPLKAWIVQTSRGKDKFML